MIQIRDTNRELAEKIVALLTERKTHHDRWQNSWNEEKADYEMEEPKEIDKLAKEIENIIKNHVDELPIDFCIEALTHLGFDIVMIYDDNGHFAITYSEWSNVRINDDEDYVFSATVSAHRFKPTIREAFIEYLNSED